MSLLFGEVELMETHYRTLLYFHPRDVTSLRRSGINGNSKFPNVLHSLLEVSLLFGEVELMETLLQYILLLIL